MTMIDAPLEQPEAHEAAAPRQSRLQSILRFELTKGRVKRKDLMHFSRQLAVFIKAGIPITDAIETIAEEMGSKRFREVLGQILLDLQGGATFTQATERFPEVFPEYYRGMLGSAELTGHLDLVLDQLSTYIERDLDSRRKVASALTYPAIVMSMSLVTVVILVSFVLPRFRTFFKSLGAKLPLPTRILLDVASFVENWWFLFVGLIGIVAIVAVLGFKTERGREVTDRLVLRLPALGDVVLYSVLERFCRVLAAMVDAGVPIAEALAVTTNATQNALFKTRLADARQAMMRGEGLARPLAATSLFPAAARQMFRVGESTGTLDQQLTTAADYFDRELDYKIKRFTALFEPAVILFVGLVVGFVAVALVSAMYGIFRSSSI